ncbi:hypothetical protein [Parapedobacter pyrenivorans]
MLFHNGRGVEGGIPSEGRAAWREKGGRKAGCSERTPGFVS